MPRGPSARPVQSGPTHQAGGEASLNLLGQDLKATVGQFPGCLLWGERGYGCGSPGPYKGYQGQGSL